MDFDDVPNPNATRYYWALLPSGAVTRPMFSQLLPNYTDIAFDLATGTVWTWDSASVTATSYFPEFPASCPEP